MYKQKDNTDLKPRSAVHKPDTLQILYDGICQIDRYWHFTNCIEKTSASLATYDKVTRIIYIHRKLCLKEFYFAAKVCFYYYYVFKTFKRTLRGKMQCMISMCKD